MDVTATLTYIQYTLGYKVSCADYILLNLGFLSFC